MYRILLLFFLCFNLLGIHLSFAYSPDHIKKPISTKVPLTKEDLSLSLKKSKLLTSEGKLEETGTPKNVSWEEADLGITPPPELANDTVEIDSHTYYNSMFYSNIKTADLWIDINSFPSEQIITHDMLSHSHRQATSVQMSFDFPFYGSYLRNITIATGGFLYMGDYLHNWIAATQYVAPLMANFDTTLSSNSTIKYADNGTMLTVQWDHVHLQERPNDGAFTFQVNLFNNGDISFVYKEIPFPVSNISDEVHPVKIGLSDAYILERTIFFVRRKTIYEYHRIDMMQKNITNNTGIYFTALPTCLMYKNCSSCVAKYETLECTWCPAVHRCSDGVDRLRQSWVSNGCMIQHTMYCHEESPEKLPDSSSTYKSTDVVTIKTTEKPFHTQSSKVISSSDYSTYDITANPYVQHASDESSQSQVGEKSFMSVSPGAIITIVLFLAIVIAIGFWVFYAYRFPQSASGQFLIKYRPARWNLKSEGHDGNSNAFHM